MARTKIFYWTTGQRSCDAEADNSRNVIPLSLFPHSLGWSWKGRRRTRCCGAGGTSCSLQKRVQVAQICNTRFPEGPVLLQRLPDYLHSRHAATLLRRLSILWPCCTHEPWRLPLLWCLLNSSRCFFHLAQQRTTNFPTESYSQFPGGMGTCHLHPLHEKLVLL